MCHPTVCLLDKISLSLQQLRAVNAGPALPTPLLDMTLDSD